MKHYDLCASSGSSIPEGGLVHCVCGHFWKDQESVPLHDTMGHRQDTKKLAKRIDEAFELTMRRRRERESIEHEKRDVYNITMIEIEKRKMIGRAKRDLRTMISR